MKTIKGNTIIEVLVSTVICSLCMVYGVNFFIKNSKSSTSLRKLDAIETAVSIYNNGIELSKLPIDGTAGDFKYSITEDASFNYPTASKVDIKVELSACKINQCLTVFIAK